MIEDEAIALITKGVQAIADLRANGHTVFVNGWVVAYEALTSEGLEDGYSDGGVIVPDRQSPAYSRGMALSATDFYRPRQTE